jgi:uncharacterized protein YacL
MKTNLISRIVGAILFAMVGFMLGVWTMNVGFVSPNNTMFLWILVGVAALLGVLFTPALTTVPIEKAKAKLNELSDQALLSVTLGFFVAVAAGALISVPLFRLPGVFGIVIPILVTIGLASIAVSVFAKRELEISLNATKKIAAAEMPDAPLTPPERKVLLDTSVIIDGRISDIARTGFVPGTLLIPNFVLNELQFIADSGDALRRQRGRRGLEVLSNMQKDALISVKITSVDVDGVNAVDEKLVVLAKQMHAPILTNDYNLNQVAEIQGVEILNINELANAIKTVFLPGETLNIRVIQEGREDGQGVGYLDDGTMVVVQDGNEYLGVELDTMVTKVLQTAAGRMIFAKPIEY